jgi:hypothetical protein
MKELRRLNRLRWRKQGPKCSLRNGPPRRLINGAYMMFQFKLRAVCHWVTCGKNRGSQHEVHS